MNEARLADTSPQNARFDSPVPPLAIFGFPRDRYEKRRLRPVRRFRRAAGTEKRRFRMHFHAGRLRVAGPACKALFGPYTCLTCDARKLVPLHAKNVPRLAVSATCGRACESLPSRF